MSGLEPLDDAALRGQLARRAAGADPVDESALRAAIASRLAGRTQRQPWLTRRGAWRPAMAVVTGALVVAVAAVVIGQTPGPLVGQTPRPTTVALSPSPGATSAPTPTPTLPPGPLARIAMIEANGVRVTIELERNPMPAGEPTWVTTTVTNTGRDDVIWLHGACAHPPDDS